MTTFLALAAATWGVAMALAPVLQMRRMAGTRSSRDVSVGYFVVLLIGFVLWLAYGIALENFAIIVPNAVALLVSVATIGLALRYRGESSP